MDLDLISYRVDAGNNIDEYFDETEVKYYDSSGILQISHYQILKSEQPMDNGLILSLSMIRPS